MTNARLILIFITGIVLSYYSVASWRPANATLFTKWTQYVSPENVHKEYPRPQLTRSEWKNLNGSWQFEFAPNLEILPATKTLAKRILVPFPIEANLSGIMGAGTAMWYRRTVRIPDEWRKERMLLHFERINGDATVFINSKRVATIANSESRASLDITEQLTESKNEILVGVNANQCGFTGKITDSFASHGISQTVWLEPVPETYLSKVEFKSDIKNNEINLRVEYTGEESDLSVNAIIYDQGTMVANVWGKAQHNIRVKIENLKKWSPLNPFLYDVQLRLCSSAAVMDSAWSYFGASDYRIESEHGDRHAIYLNGEKFSQLAVEHYGFWPDGIITPPSDKAISSDIQNVKNLGFNLIINKGVKPSDRWLYWCDKTGLLVWQYHSKNLNHGKNATVSCTSTYYSDFASHPSFAAVIADHRFFEENNAKLAIHAIDFRLNEQTTGEISVLYMQPDTIVSSFDFDNYNYSSLTLSDEFEKVWYKFDDGSFVSKEPKSFSLAAIAFNTMEYHKNLTLARQKAENHGIETIVYPQLCDLPGKKFGLQTDDRRLFKVNLHQVYRFNCGKEKS